MTTTMPARFAAVSEGDLLPALELPPVTREMLIRYAEASRDRNPVHTDSAAARAVGARDVFAHGMLQMAWLSRVITDWTAQHRMREFDARFVAMTLPGERITCMGRIIEKRLDGSETLVRIALAAVNEAGETKVAGEALVALP
jgi:acyl dehydratase